MQTTKFPLGQTVMTAAARDALDPFDVLPTLSRHARGDWGDCCKEDRDENETALKEGFRLFSVYRSSQGVRFWIITEADRSVTRVILPEDYQRGILAARSIPCAACPFAPQNALAALYREASLASCQGAHSPRIAQH